MEHIQLIEDSHDIWNVTVGSVAINMLERKRLQDDEKDRVIAESVEILGCCGNPSNPSNNITGLAIGYVQSGKTMSFTTLSALAAQNGFNVIIVIAGTTTKLVDQTHLRLATDLDIYSSFEVSWKSYKNPGVKQADEVIGDLESGLLNKSPVLLITVMKNNTHLKKLVSLFKKVQKYTECKVLIIDDEADQASLNTKASKKDEDSVSATYNTITSLKNILSNHTFVQYTATPQAPLFISVLDILSPSFVKILTPGKAYTGGRTFFARNSDSSYPYVVDIPEIEVFTKSNEFSTIPPTLVESTMIFFITVVIGALEGESSKNHNRTMMVHPSQLTYIHSVYKRWLDNLKKRWLDELSLKDSDPDKLNLLNQFQAAYDKLSLTADSLISFDEIKKHLHYVIKITPIFESNSTTKQEINWKKYYSMILVGGQVLDRGFTIEGLNVTYMPRSIGVGNADTIQQRCRFFGYKKSYLKYCRIYLPRTSKRAYIDYVMHEEDMRNKLLNFQGKHKSLKDFKRSFVLSPDLNITRKNVISDEVSRYRLKGWRSFDRVETINELNNNIIETFLTHIELTNFDQRLLNPNSAQIHTRAIIDFKTVFEGLLLNLDFHNPVNSLLCNHLISLFSIFSDSSLIDEIYVVNISSGEQRERSTNELGKIKNLFQGKNPKTEYPGDRKYFSKELVTIQIHNLKIKSSNKIFRTLAFHLPASFEQDIITLEN